VANGMLKAWAEAGESGPVIVLVGEADLTSAGLIDTLLAGQLADGTWQLTIDLSGLRFADAASLRALAMAARTLTERGGSLVVLNPQPSVARAMALLDVDEVIAIRRDPHLPAPGNQAAEGSSTRPRTGRDTKGTR
jgi:anti-anti-sigma factor